MKTKYTIVITDSSFEGSDKQNEFVGAMSSHYSGKDPLIFQQGNYKNKKVPAYTTHDKKLAALGSKTLKSMHVAHELLTQKLFDMSGLL